MDENDELAREVVGVSVVFYCLFTSL